MNDNWLRRSAWGLAVIALALLGLSAILLAAVTVPDKGTIDWLANQVAALATLGAPILGLVILRRQPRQRVGWLWIIYGIVVGLRALGTAIYLLPGSPYTGYSALELLLIWLTEPTNMADIVCLILLMLWFPSGQLLSRKWRILYLSLFIAIVLLFFPALFEAGPNWNGGASAGGIIVDNPYGWLPEGTPGFAFFGFLSMVLMLVLAALSLVFRYRSAGELVRLQLRWFVLGGLLLVGLTFLHILGLGENVENGTALFIAVLSSSAIAPLYLAVGAAILRYRLYDIDVIIRKTLIYTVLTTVLALIFFGGITLLESVVSVVTGQHSALATVLSTLAIAALFSPLRRRIQNDIDRFFYRRKYDARQTLAAFAATARDETDLDALASELERVVEETMQPAHVSLWLREPSAATDQRILS